MTKSKTTRRALLSSCVALMLCFSMLLGTTYAWFTDSVTSQNNIITAGNLDVELEYYKDGGWKTVETDTNVFEEDTLWEPGHTEVVYLKVSNLGTLALKYHLGVNIVSEIESINVAGEALRLSDYIKFGAIEGVSTPYADRDDAVAAVEDDAKKLSEGYTKTGEMEAAVPAQYVALVVYMPKDVENEANYRTGEVAPEITLGINLLATQMEAELDSFGKDYDKDSLFGGAPMAHVTKLAVMPEVTTINGNTYPLSTGYIFETTDTYGEAQLNAHRYWHADFVASFDKDVDDADVGLAGQYDTYSHDWLAFELDGFGDIKANAPVRMLEYAGISMNYEELCNLVKKFSCGAFAVDPEAMAGTTMTVELRLYETTIDPNATSGSANDETGKYITIGTYSYKFPAAKANGQQELADAIAAGVTDIELAAGDYTMPTTNGDVTISGTKDTVITVNKPTAAKVTLSGVTVQGSGIYTGIQHSEKVVYEDCVIKGVQSLYAEEVIIKNCTIDLTEVVDYIWTYGAKKVTFDGCTFNTNGKAILIYSEDANLVTNVTVKNCTFNATASAQASGATAAAIEIDSSLATNGHYTLTTENNTVDSDFSGEWRVKKSGTDNTTVNGVVYNAITIG